MNTVSILKSNNMIATYNKLPFAELIYSNKINPHLKEILDKTDRLLKRKEIVNLCTLYQTTEDLESVNNNIEKLNEGWKHTGLSWN